MPVSNEIGPVCTKILNLDEALTTLETFCDFTEGYELRHMRQVISETLGTDTKFSPKTPYGELYAPDTGWKEHPAVVTNRELGAALAIIAAETARSALASPVDTLVRTSVQQAFHQQQVDEFVAKRRNMPAAVALYLCDVKGRDEVRARFPQAGLTDDRIGAVLKTTDAELPSLKQRQALLPQWATGKVPVARPA